MEPRKAFEGPNATYVKNSHARAPSTRIRLWDLPIRVFHWSLAVAVLVAFVTAQIGGSLMEIHSKAGFTIIGLVVFRVVWGFIGSTHARFASFAPSPAKIRAYVRGRWQGVGHNPLGAFSVFALLALLSLQATTGLFSNNDIDFNGPLYALVDKTLSDRLTGLHHLLSNFLLGLVVLHIGAIIFYLWFKKDNLVKPMVTGWKEVQSGKPAAQGSLVALITAIWIALVVVYAVSSAGPDEVPPTSTPSNHSTSAW
ncbi:MAG: cytochrome b/b6 domain-containing protein [Pseudomonadota bacterium]